MDQFIKNKMDSIKEPNLKFELMPCHFNTPSLKSYIGGKPYIKTEEAYPTCGDCNHSLDFMFQLYIPNKKGYDLFVFYLCNKCDPFESTKNFEMRVYKNPNLNDANLKVKPNESISNLEFNFYPSWSIPDWDTLNKLKPDDANEILNKYKDEAWILYENTKDALESIVFMEPFSFYGGYPQFFSESTFPKCSCCNKDMDFWLQIDSLEDHGINWAKTNGCLFIFKCHKTNTFKAIIQ